MIDTSMNHYCLLGNATVLYVFSHLDIEEYFSLMMDEDGWYIYLSPCLSLVATVCIKGKETNS
jgi:hypothetical protein